MGAFAIVLCKHFLITYSINYYEMRKKSTISETLSGDLCSQVQYFQRHIFSRDVEVSLYFKFQLVAGITVDGIL